MRVAPALAAALFVFVIAATAAENATEGGIIAAAENATDGEADAKVRLPLTVAEASNYTETASHEQVVRFLDELRALGAPVEVRTIGESHEGRPMVLAILGAAEPPSVAERDRVVVCVQANIHAGEVEGKEAILMLLRDLALGGRFPDILEGCILLVLPNYNVDGNDKFAPVAQNRPGQQGPARVGKRHNAQNLDLNRDYIKARSTEFPVVARQVFNTWDPDIFMDLHTTNGSYHGYTLTYGPPLHPGGPRESLEFVRDEMIPNVRRSMRKQNGYETFDYGNFGGYDEDGQPTRWSTYDYRGRMGWLYAGLRGRIGILSEAYSYAPFQNRIDATYWFVKHVLSYAAAHRAEILDMHRRIDAETLAWGRDPSTAPQIALRATPARRPTDEWVYIETTSDPPEGQRRRVREGLIYTRKLAIWDRFDPALEVRFPAGYYLPPDMTEAVEMLRMHGIEVETIDRPWRGDAERFVPTSVETQNRRFSGGVQSDLAVERQTAVATADAGWFWVPTAQRQGRLAVHLLEPDAPDSLFTWQRAGVEAKVGEPIPYFRTFEPRP